MASVVTAAGLAADMLDELDHSKLPLAVPAAVGVLRTALADNSKRASAPRPATGNPELPLYITLQLVGDAGPSEARWEARCNKSAGMFMDHKTPHAALSALLAGIGVGERAGGHPTEPELRAEFVRQHEGRDLRQHPLRGTYYRADIAALWNQHRRTANWMMQRGAAPADLTAAARDVLAERRRQVEVEGWAPPHDDQYEQGQMAQAAACYATGHPAMWPWPDSWWKPRDERSNLVRAGALILAEIERLDRSTHQPSPQLKPCSMEEWNAARTVTLPPICSRCALGPCTETAAHPPSAQDGREA